MHFIRTTVGIVLPNFIKSIKNINFQIKSTNLVDLKE
jgi:hypothetical protein